MKGERWTSVGGCKELNAEPKSIHTRQLESQSSCFYCQGQGTLRSLDSSSNIDLHMPITKV